MDYLKHFGVKGMKWGVRKDKGSTSENQKFRDSVTSATEKQIRSDVDKYGALEASERISTYAYNDGLKIMRKETKGRTLTREEAEPYWDLEGELIDRYDEYGWNYAESKRKMNHSDISLSHYGMPKRSGRYPYGSGKEPAADNPRGQKLAKKYAKNPDVLLAKKAISDPSILATIETKELTDLANRIDAVSRLRTQIGKYESENQSTMQRARHFIAGQGKKLLGKAVSEVSTFAFNKLMEHIKTQYSTKNPLKDLSTMTDAKLKEEVARMALENSYRNFEKAKNKK